MRWPLPSAITCLILAALGSLAGLGPSGCSSKEARAPYYDSGEDSGEGGSSGLPSNSAGNSGAPAEDLTGLCGNEILPVITERPNLYLVLDRSGSMASAMDATASDSPSKYDASLEAIHQVLFTIGHRLAYGATVFPSNSDTDVCAHGIAIDSVKSGDSVTYARSGLDGPHLTALMDVLNGYTPQGATPTEATMTYVLPLLTELEGDTAVILTTDGAPNCNGDITCDATRCIPNIEGALRTNGEACDSSYNCCAATADYGPWNCIDEAATLEPIAELLTTGIKTYVIGLPGSEAYESVMNAMAEAGGTARERESDSDPAYYSVEDSEALASALKTIVASLSISCTIDLDDPPPDWTMVNVYFDNGVIALDEENGWQQVDDDTLELVGDSCTLLKSGDVFQVQVVSGCPTEIVY